MSMSLRPAGSATPRCSPEHTDRPPRPPPIYRIVYYRSLRGFSLQMTAGQHLAMIDPIDIRPRQVIHSIKHILKCHEMNDMCN